MAIIHDLPVGEYHASHRLSASKIRTFLSRGPRFYHMKHVARTLPEEDKEEFVFGRLFESAWEHHVTTGGDGGGRDALAIRMDPDDVAMFHDADGVCYAIKPEGPAGDGRTKEGKAWKESVGSTPVITRDDVRNMFAMVGSLGEHALVMTLLRNAKRQPTLTGVLCNVEIQARPDYLLFDGCAESAWAPMSIDLKTTKSINGFFRGPAIVDYGYDIQAALVHELCEQNGITSPIITNLVVEKCLPHRRELFDLSAWLEPARALLMAALTEIAKCQQAKSWPRGEDSMVRLEPPRWYLARQAAE